MQRLETTSTTVGVATAIIGYSLCSSTLLLANKMVMQYLPFPSIVSLIQIVASAFAVLVYQTLGGKVDRLEWPKVKAYSLYTMLFVTAIYASMKALAHSNVETVIVFRACSPIAVTILECHFMNRAWPSIRSSFSLFIVAIGAILYCLNDSEFAWKGIQTYYWVMIYFLLYTFEMAYGKKLISMVKMESIWGPVMYCNLLAILPMGCIAYLSGELTQQAKLLTCFQTMPMNGIALLIFSCVAGTIIGYMGWWCRSMISAAMFTLTGVVNKFFTVLLNVILWEKHSTPMGTLAVCLCLLGGTLYQETPPLKRSSMEKEEEEAEEREKKTKLH